MPQNPSRRIPLRGRLLAAFALVGGLLLLSAGLASAQAFPPQAVSEEGQDIRDLYFVVFGFAAAVFVVVEVGIVWLALRYRRRNDDLPPQIHGSQKVEIVWTIIPTVIVAILFAVSFIVLDEIESAPGADEPVEVIDVMGQQWAWAFAYATPVDATTSAAVIRDPNSTQLQVSNGAAFQAFATYRIDVEHFRVDAVSGNTLTIQRGVDGTVLQDHPAGAAIDRIFNGTEFSADDRGELTDTVDPSSGDTITANTPIVTVPVGKTVRFNISSRDVIHSFYTPQFLYKLDAVPGRTQALWLKVTDAGFYQGQCAEFCGREHARMLFSVRALPLDEYNDWLQSLVDGLGAGATARPPSDDTATDAAAPVDAAPAAGAVDPARGQQVFFQNGCNVCHGDTGQGGIGPTLAQTSFSLEQELQQYRNPRGVMPRFDESVIPDEDVANVLAWLQTLPLPDSIVPGEGTP